MITKNITVHGSRGGNPVLDQISVEFKPGKMNALIGPSGCGKTTLVRALVGLTPFEGQVHFQGFQLQGREDRVGRIGYVPQFCVAHPELTVRESIDYSLRILGQSPDVREKEVVRILEETGLSSLKDQLVRRLSGGQLRRMALALELAPDPELLFCDEVTAGLDPESEEMILDLIRNLVVGYGKTTVNVIHNLHHLQRFDWIVVLEKGKVLFQGDFAQFSAWFSLEQSVHLFRLLEESAGTLNWEEKWRNEGESATGNESLDKDLRAREEASTLDPKGLERKDYPSIRPSFFSQTGALLHRRATLFLRDRGFLWLTIAISLGFPVLVILFALDGIPQLERFSLAPDIGLFEQLRGQIAYGREAAVLGSLVSSLILFQVVLLTLTGSNNGAREISGERDLLLQESLRGLRPGPYCTEKLLFTGIIAVVQGSIMTVLVKVVCHFPGSWLVQCTTLILVSLALSWLALGFSAWMKSSEKASLLAVYIVGFQLPLSGIVLALPEPFTDVLRMVITTYWGWAAYLAAFRDSGLYDAAVYVTNESVPVIGLSLFMLFLHVIGAAILVIGGVTHLYRK